MSKDSETPHPIAYRYRYRHIRHWTLRSTPVSGDSVICEPLYAAGPRPSAMRKALDAARSEIVLTLAFLGRDEGTMRLPATIAGLTKRLAAADKKIRAALAGSEGAP